MSKRGGPSPASLGSDGGGGGERIAAAALAGEEEGITGDSPTRLAGQNRITPNKPGDCIRRM